MLITFGEADLGEQLKALLDNLTPAQIEPYDAGRPRLALLVPSRDE